MGNLSNISMMQTVELSKFLWEKKNKIEIWNGDNVHLARVCGISITLRFKSGVLMQDIINQLKPISN